MEYHWYRFLVVVVVWLALATLARAEEPRPAGPEDDPLGLRKTQVTIDLDEVSQRIQLQATVIAKGEDTLTVLTAAHGLSPADVGRSIRLHRGEAALTARLLRVARNPSYRPLPAAEIPGADNAFALFRVTPGDEAEARFLRMLQPAQLAPLPLPDPDGQTIWVHVLDQKGAIRVLRAGNYSNPFLLEWGPSFQPIPGDSGSGVFVVRPGADGRPRALLIGSVVVRTSRGGNASLIHNRLRWVAESLANRPARGG
ncbi:MAG: hypothetical protein IRY99_20690 [Isosphaeraceae bacterium]|nr:hypothetical protein [Isosphaeraceae bacterium]